MAANPLHLVIDANVARAAGPEGAVFPTSKKCREFLLAVENYNFMIVSTPELREEWNKHQSRFFRTWRVRMMGRKRISMRESQSSEDLRRRLIEFAQNEGEQEGMLKDCHLLEAALSSDLRIVSLETYVRKHFARACSKIEEIRAILWINPNDDTEMVILWLEEGAPADRHRRLENYLENSA